MSRSEPWHGQSQVLSVGFQSTIHPRCGHTAEHSCIAVQSFELTLYLFLGNDFFDAIYRGGMTADQNESIASFPAVPLEMISGLRDGRAIVTSRTGGRNRLVAIEKGKDPVPLTSTVEETSAPMTVAGPREIAFVIGPAPHQTIAVTDTASGRITRRIPLKKGEIISLASSPDGKTSYGAADGTIWSVSSSGGEPRRIRAGDSVVADPGRSW